jgi:SpoIIAA-like
VRVRSASFFKRHAILRSGPWRTLSEGEFLMLEKIPDLPDSAVGIKASGKITADDYRNVVTPAVEAALEGEHNLRFLYVLGEDVTGCSPGAAWQDTKVGVGHYNRWEKVAVVFDKEWLRHSVDIFGYLVPGEVKAFTPAEVAEARTWVSN